LEPKSINCGNINGKNIQAFGLVPATKNPSLKKEKLLFEILFMSDKPLGLDL
jgi:hypothetical protein